MKLLFDENLSPRLAKLLGDLFPASSHVHFLGLGEAPDSEIWDVALGENWIIVTRDTDFLDYSAAFGFPPFVVMIRLGNCPTSEVLATLSQNAEMIHALSQQNAVGVISLS